MIAIPARIRNDEVILTTIFGRSEKVAFVDDQGRIEVKRNEFQGGVDLATWLINLGVKTVVMRNMGANPYLALQKGGVKVYATAKTRAPVQEIVDDLHNGELIEVTPENMANYLKAGQHRHERDQAHGRNHQHGHEHHHG
jgi:predicted Fe-Mo cluster-binding NifX family protein